MRHLLLFFILSCANAATLFKGDDCLDDGVIGICTPIQDCVTARERLKEKKRPQICTFEGVEVTVCCVNSTTISTTASTTTLTTPELTTRRSSQAQPVTPESGTTAKPFVATTVSRPTQSTTEYTPQNYEYEYVSTIERVEGCLPISANLTATKTGQKAWDKCIEYQEKYVYPCEKTVALFSSMARVNHCHHSADQLIVGGVNADLNEFPHMVLLGYGELSTVQWACGGAIISDWFILTAGHCISSRDLGGITYAGSTHNRNKIDPSRIYKIKKIIKHPGYKPPSKYNDIALLETDVQMKLDQFMNPACLYTGDVVNDSRALATGWGLTQHRGDNSDVLQKVILNKFTTEECSVQYAPTRLMKQGFNTTTQICFGDKNESKDTCQGDSGGPLQIKSRKVYCMYVIIGVTSFGKGCGFVGTPGIYTKVDAYLPWIEQIVWP